MFALTRIRFLILFCLLFAVQNSYALPFSVVTKSGTTLPTTFPSTAFYTVTNNTQSQRNNSFVKYLPPNTTQVTSGGAGTCGTTFNLAPGGSCTLQLTVSGAINGNDPNPHNHLFVCFPGGTTCAGTPNPLNVGNQPFNIQAYVTEKSINAVSLCTTNADGTFSQCAHTGSGFNHPVGGAINPAGTFLYISNLDSNTISYCAIQADKSLTNCVTALSGIKTFGLAFNPAGTFAYVADFLTDKVLRCDVQNDGTLGSCISTGSGFFQPISITLNPQGTFAYVGSANQPGFIGSVCTVNPDGTLSSCHFTGGVATSLFFPRSMVINATNTFFYAADSNSGNDVTFCSIDSSTGDLSACVATVNGLDTPQGLALNNANHFAYVSNTGANQVLYCLINTNGSLSNCLSTGAVFSSPAGIVLVSAT